MTFKKLAFAMSLAAAAASANAWNITNADGTFSNFGGFDWHSSGSVYVQGYDVLSNTATGTVDPFKMTYQAFATSVLDSSGTSFLTPGLRVGSGSGYEYTINATFNEQVTCLSDGLNTCGIVKIDVVGGLFDIFYQLAGNAVAGSSGMAGILDGTKIASGVFTSGNSLLGTQGASNPGNVTLSGTFRGEVTYTNSAYITPDLIGTLAVSTLQFGRNTTSWTRPNNFDGIGAIGADTNTDFVGQADANQSFVPEPGSLSLLGAALGLVGLLQRRRKLV